MAGMGCTSSGSRPSSSRPRSSYPERETPRKARNMRQPERTMMQGETVVQAYLRLEKSISKAELEAPAAQLASLLPTLQALQQDLIKNGESLHSLTSAGEKQDDALTQVIIDLKLSSDPQLAAEHEEFVANINRQAILQFDHSLMESRFMELSEKKKTLEAEVLNLQQLYKEQDQLLESALGAQYGSLSERSLEARAGRSRALRDTLAAAARPWREAAAHAALAHAAAAQALLAWQLAPHAKSPGEAVHLCLEARCSLLQGSREVSSARQALPSVSFPHCTARQMQALLLTIDYMFTDMYSQERYKHAVRVFTGFSERTLALTTWITEILKSSLEHDLEEVEASVEGISRELRTIRVNLIADKGLTDVIYKTA